MITFKQIKDICTAICNAYGITETDGKRIAKELSQDQLAAVLAGDLSSVPAVAARLGINYQAKQPDGIREPDHGKEDHTPTKARKCSKKEKLIGCTPAPVATHDDILETVQGEIVGDSYNNELLPPSIMTDIEDKLSEFSSRYNIDLEKCSNLQWRSACMYVGRYLQASGIFLDREKLKRGGSKYYKAETIAAMLPIWEYLTGLYKHIPLACDFVSFVGVSTEWFYDTENRLSSSRVDLAKKVRAVEESALSAALTDHKENPTGRIYYTKARLGWQETTTIQHVSATATTPAVALPVFDNSITSLPDNTLKSS